MLKDRNRDAFRNVEKRFRELEVKVNQAMLASDEDPENLEKLVQLVYNQRERNDANARYEMFLRDKAK